MQSGDQRCGISLMRLGKKRRYRFKVGQLSRWKKAIVKLHGEDRIEFF